MWRRFIESLRAVTVRGISNWRDFPTSWQTSLRSQLTKWENTCLANSLSSLQLQPNLIQKTRLGGGDPEGRETNFRKVHAHHRLRKKSSSL